ncbi:hypothetical protein D5H75_28810 [Bailinhaonella thermotolerans]|uniref:Lantibiotic dehydratase n=1 Tax=Bailinhaonella thermotolerans TaxID=1070861 RepID=A0A3A4A838_9ACTN|nr:hypothetical protein D5H75_28810 [Bailinhaonella thermotolerans]
MAREAAGALADTGTPFRPAGFVLARLSAGDAPSARPPAGPGGEPEFLRSLAADPVAREAIAVSSESLAAAIDRAGDLSPARAARAALAAARYLSRMTSRATPFGLMAGVAPARFGPGAGFRVRGRRKHVRPDMAWLTALARRLETGEDVLPRLRLLANDLCSVRGDRLVLPYVRDDPGGLDREHSLRLTAPARAALAAARAPIPYPDLLARLRAEFPRAGGDRVRGLVAELVRHEFLLTDLRPPPSSPDPLGHVAARLPPAAPGRETRAALEEVGGLLAGFRDAPPGAGLRAWRAAVRRMRELQPGDRVIQVDLGLDADIEIPHAVGAELAAAVGAAWRAAPPPDDPLAAYRAEFADRYGEAGLVPVRDLLDPHRGLGPPAGYLRPPGHRAAPPPARSPRDDVLLEVAQRAARRGDREVVLDEELAGRLARPGGDPPRYVEPAARLLAASTEALARGEFLLVLTGPAFTRPGAMFGRFLHLVPGPGDDLAALLARLAAPAEPVQLHGALPRPRDLNVAQVPRLTPLTLNPGVFREGPGALGLDDVLAGLGPGGFRLVCRRTGRELAPMPVHALNPAFSMPNAVRFLLDAGAGRTPWWPVWSWGEAARLPYLPRVRRGRTVLSPARWRVPAGLPGDAAAFARWRAEWDVPDVVRAVHGDRDLRLDLTRPLDLRLLRAELRRHPGTHLAEDFSGDTSWSGPHTAEIVIPLVPAAARPPGPPAAPPREEPRVPAARGAVTAYSRREAHPPGGEWLYVKAHVAPGRQREVLARWLPGLVERAEPVCDRWFFLRHADGAAHLRVRFHGDPDALARRLLPEVHRWASGLAGAGLAGDVELGTYRPEITRYGGAGAIEAAERAFQADSRSVLEQLAAREEARGAGLADEALAAANLLDLAARLMPDGWREWLCAAYPKDERHHAAYRRDRALADALPDPARLPGGDLLAASWERRAPHVEAYGRLVRAISPGAADTAFTGLLHMHCNRLLGTSRAAERDALAIARGAVQAGLGRERRPAR